MKKSLIATLALAVVAPVAMAHEYVLLDTTRGPIVLELDDAKAPKTVAHFLQIIDENFYDGLIFHRTIPNFVAQTGGFTTGFTPRTRSPNTTVESERNNGLKHDRGTLGVALPSGSNGQPSYDAGTTEIFVNTGTNSHLDGQYTVFGRVVQGMAVVDAIGNAPTGANGLPVNPVLIEDAERIDGMPILPLHTGAWYDPQNSGRGLSIEVGQVAGGDGTPLLIAYWYDYAEGRQIWMNGAATFAYGDTEVTLSVQITDGGQFGEDFDPSQVTSDTGFGTLTIRFDDCSTGTFSYDTAYGSGSMPVTRISIPDGQRCQ